MAIRFLDQMAKHGLMQALEKIDHPVFLAGAAPVAKATIGDWQRYCREARELLVESGLLESYREAICPLAELGADDPDCRENRVLDNLFVPKDEAPNPEWVGA